MSLVGENGRMLFFTKKEPGGMGSSWLNIVRLHSLSLSLAPGVSGPKALDSAGTHRAGIPGTGSHRVLFG
jgi:hypothetical protein